MIACQGSLLDRAGRIGPRRAAPPPTRIGLGSGAWVEHRHLWLEGGAELLEALLEVVPWRAERRWMYDRFVEVPRLTCFYEEGEALPHPALEEVRASLDAGYRAEAGGGFDTCGLALYRDGGDSVAWHGDRIGRGATQDTVVAIVSLGATRTLALRPRGGGRARRYELASGDLLVMGGSCQRSFDHSVPKTARPVGARVSLQFRPSGVR